MKTTIDWLKFRSKMGPFELLELVRPAFGTVGEMLELKTGAKPRDGWTHAAEICIPDHVIAHIDYGGNSQRDWVRFDMPGTGCGWVQFWEHFGTFADLVDCEIVRMDIAFTTSDPLVVSDSKVVAAFEAGKSGGAACGMGGGRGCQRSAGRRLGCCGFTGYGSI